MFAKLSVTNGHAERGIAITDAFPGLMTKDEDQLLYILQVVADHRCIVPHGVKQSLKQ